jgi:DNA-binding NarL/FixJ family response regulator
MEVRAMPTIAIVCAGNDGRDSLCAGLEAEGFEAVVARLAEIRTGELDLITFLEEHDPQVIVYEVGRPYAQSLTFLRLLQDTAIGRHRAWVLAADDADAVTELLDATMPVPEVSAPGTVVQAVRRALAGRGRRPAAAA